MSFAYGDPRGLLTGVTRGTETVRYGRTASGEVEYAESPAGRVSYGYDGYDRLSSITSSERTTTVSWEPGGARLLELSDGVSLRECRRYDARGRVRLVANVLPGDVCEDATAPLAEYRYEYDERGNRLLEEYRDPVRTTAERTSYGYDKADRLTGVQEPDGTGRLYRLGGDGSRLGEKKIVNQ